MSQYLHLLKACQTLALNNATNILVGGYGGLYHPNRHYKKIWKSEGQRKVLRLYWKLVRPSIEVVYGEVPVNSI